MQVTNIFRLLNNILISEEDDQKLVLANIPGFLIGAKSFVQLAMVLNNWVFKASKDLSSLKLDYSKAKVQDHEKKLSL